MVCIRTGTVKYRKFQVAVERLSKEQDIQYIIEMNRISHLLHKMNFLVRQRRAVKYSRKYVISVNDTKQEAAEKDECQDPTTKVLQGFDPIKN